MTTFSPSQFTPTQWDSAEDKAWFANQFVRFIRSACDERYFTTKFYRRLSCCFGHIAHYNKDGFWNEFFMDFPDTIRFLDWTLHHPCNGDPACTYSDVERALQDWLEADETLRRFRSALEAERRAIEEYEVEREQRTRR
jgi:hypothetical protein